MDAKAPSFPAPPAQEINAFDPSPSSRRRSLSGSDRRLVTRFKQFTRLVQPDDDSGSLAAINRHGFGFKSIPAFIPEIKRLKLCYLQRSVCSVSHFHLDSYTVKPKIHLNRSALA